MLEKTQTDPFVGLERGYYRAILADPPWRFATWDNATTVKARGPERHGTYTSARVHYLTMTLDEMVALPVRELTADDCALFLWASWPMLEAALILIRSWGFEYKTAAFVWAKAHAGQLEMFQDHVDPLMGMGYWTRANSEPCLLATRGNPKRLNADVRQAIIEPRREHSRKPDCVRERIERLVEGPYLELFARSRREGWDAWGDETDRFTQGACG